MLSHEQAEAARTELLSFSGDARQEAINRLTDVEQIDDEIRDVARSAHRLYPQYDGAFDGDDLRVGRMRGPITTKGGLRFAAGDVVLFRAPFDGWAYPIGRECTAYSVRGGIMVEIRRSWIEALS